MKITQIKVNGTGSGEAGGDIEIRISNPNGSGSNSDEQTLDMLSQLKTKLQRRAKRELSLRRKYKDLK